MTKHQITRMRVVSDDAELIHTQGGNAVAIGTRETFNGKEYEVIDNTAFNVVVTYAPVGE